jgi:4-alpha-glucanotransferase
MPRSAALSSLHELAEAHGVQTAYQDATGRRREASAEALLRVLQVLGVPVTRPGDARAALREHRQAQWRRGLEPVTVAWEGERPAVLVHLPAAAGRRDVKLRLGPEDGTGRAWTFRPASIPDSERGRVGRAAYVAKRLVLPEAVPLGYHQLTLETSAGDFQALLLCAPRQAYVPPAEGPERSWGVFLPLYALHTQHSWGCGDLSDLEALLDWVGRQGGGLVGTVPLLAAFLDEPFEPSPYSPASRLFWNEVYLDVSRAPELAGCEEDRRLMRSAEFVEELLVVRDARLVDYRRVMALKRRVLAPLARALFAGDSPRRTALEQHVRANPQLDDYATFRAVLERRRTPWSSWPAPLCDGVVADGDYDLEAKRYHLYVQWLAHEQMRALAGRARALGPGMYLDLPLGVHADGYDVWRERPAFAAGVAGGCPPDVVFPKGQDWGFAPLHPLGIREQGYRYVRAFVRHHLQLAGVLRIDHMPSFHRVFWIPRGLEARDGVYVRYPAEELYALFCLESQRHHTLLVGEDLGTVPPEVPEAMARHRLHRMHVIQYEAKPDPERALPEPPAAGIASVNTHDMPPFAAYWARDDVRQRHELGLLNREAFEREWEERGRMRDALEQFLRDRGLLGEAAKLEDVYEACLHFLAEGPTRMVLANLEDLWLEVQSQNVPSTSQECPNWRRKARFALEEVMRLPEAARLLEELDRLVRGRQTPDDDVTAAPALAACDPSRARQ